MARTIAAAGCIAALLLCAGLSAEQRSASDECVSMVVVGLAPIGEDGDLEQAHADALTHARRNALLQASVLVEAEKQVEDLRLSKVHQRVRTGGRVESLSILEAGPVPDARPPFYRVRARAVVRPLPADTMPLPQGGQRWQPIVTVKGPADLPSGGVREGVAKLMGSLRGCGVTVRRVNEPGPALRLALEVTSRKGTEGESFQVCWRLGTGTPGGAEPGQEPITFAGVSRHSGETGPSVVWWERQGVAIARDAFRLWAIPRATSIRFTTRSQGAAAQLRGAFESQTDAGIRLETVGAQTAVLITLNVAGNPRTVVTGVLASAGLDGRFVLAEGALDSLVYREIEGVPGEPVRPGQQGAVDSGCPGGASALAADLP
ncbi:MAG: hypothetical protein PVJ27_04575 [Candidatus Brocadiaceae bacterium]|jgi:hypothetical protein